MIELQSGGSKHLLIKRTKESDTRRDQQVDSHHWEDIMVLGGSVIIEENMAYLIYKVKDLGARNLRRERDQDV